MKFLFDEPRHNNDDVKEDLRNKGAAAAFGSVFSDIIGDRFFFGGCWCAITGKRRRRRLIRFVLDGVDDLIPFTK